MAEPRSILMLAPHPFFQERGTPIANMLVLEGYARHQRPVRVLTFSEGEDRAWPGGTTVERVQPHPSVRGIGPGFSLKKIYTDLFLYHRAVRRVREDRPAWIHAVEESVFMARRLHDRFGVPYLYDMDSSLAMQMEEKMPWLRPVRGLMTSWEGWAIRKASLVAAITQSLADYARARGARDTRVLPDISLLPPDRGEPMGFRRELNLTGMVFMYIGNLERYQGVDLLLESFAAAWPRLPDASLVVVGGTPPHIVHYRGRAARLGLEGRVHFTGPRPSRDLGRMVQEADVLVSPRVRGINTPMKVYSYMDSGCALLATRLPTHTQVLDDSMALLAAPEPCAFGEAMTRLAGDPNLRRQLAAAARARAQNEYSRDAYFRRFDVLMEAMSAPGA